MIPGLVSVPNKGYMNNYKDNTNHMDDVMNEPTKDWSNHSANNNTDVNKDKNEFLRNVLTPNKSLLY